MSVFSQSTLLNLRRSLLTWYQQQGRSLPWRLETDPYRIWISEIMLQQTQVKTVLPYYQRWLEQFPTLESLANAQLQTVLKAWEGLGYYARCRHLHKTAQIVAKDYDGIFPSTLEAVLALPGIGRTTAGGILSSAFGQRISILDGNVKRVLARLIALPLPQSKALPDLWQLSDILIDPDQPKSFNQGLMDLGATLCTPKNPNCSQCPWQSYCQAFQLNLQTQLPMKEKSAPLPHKNIGVAVILDQDQNILIDRRPEKGLLGGLWEFPGGKIEANETVEACIQREIKEELNIEIKVGKHLITVDHAYTHFKVSLRVYLCEHLSGIPEAIACEEIRWVTIDEIDQFPFPKANKTIISALKDYLSQG